MASVGGSPRRTVTAKSGRQGGRSAHRRKCLFTAPQDNLGGREVGSVGIPTANTAEGVAVRPVILMDMTAPCTGASSRGA